MPDQINRLLFLYTESSLHAGTGSSVSAVDLPIQRERATQYPLVQSSGVKGALRSQCNLADEWIRVIFGPDTNGADEHAGAISVGDAQIVLFPVRSLAGVFAFATSHLALARLARLTQWGLSLPASPASDSAVVTNPSVVVAGNNRVVLEEFSFSTHQDNNLDQIAQWLAANAFPADTAYSYWREKVITSLVLLPENAFRDFVVSSTEIVTRVRLDPGKKTVASGALWTQEALPSDVLLVSPLVLRGSRWAQYADTSAEQVAEAMIGGYGARIQLGGDETTGQGVVALRWA